MGESSSRTQETALPADSAQPSISNTSPVRGPDVVDPLTLTPTNPAPTNPAPTKPTPTGSDPSTDLTAISRSPILDDSATRVLSKDQLNDTSLSDESDFSADRDLLRNEYKSTRAQAQPELQPNDRGTAAAQADSTSKPPKSDSSSGIVTDKTVISQTPIAEPNDFYPPGAIASLASVLIGQPLDHFQLHELVGGGGMGAVFRASDTRLDRTVAVKVIPNLGRDQETLRRFRIEAQSAAKLDHPNIARVYYVGETEAWSYIVFEFVEGINLRDLIVRNGPLSIDDAVCYTKQVAEALQHATDRNVVHRDIKPSNVLVTPEGVIKVVDMGLARTTELDRSTNDLTASGVTLGTFDYISPEQARDPRAADVRSDLYSLGCTIYYMLTGRPPFPEGTAIQKLMMHGTVIAEDPRSFRDDIPGDLVAIVRRLMAKRAIDRYQSPVDLIADLQWLADAENLVKSQHTGGLYIAPVDSQKTIIELLLPWTVSCVLLLAFGWYFYQQHRSNANYTIPTQQEFISQLPPKDFSNANIKSPSEVNAKSNTNDFPAASGNQTSPRINNELLPGNEPPTKTGSPISPSLNDVDASSNNKRLNDTNVTSRQQAEIPNTASTNTVLSTTGSPTTGENKSPESSVLKPLLKTNAPSDSPRQTVSTTLTSEQRAYLGNKAANAVATPANNKDVNSVIDTPSTNLPSDTELPNSNSQTLTNIDPITKKRTSSSSETSPLAESETSETALRQIGVSKLAGDVDSKTATTGVPESAPLNNNVSGEVARTVRFQSIHDAMELAAAQDSIQFIDLEDETILLDRPIVIPRDGLTMGAATGRRTKIDWRIASETMPQFDEANHEEWIVGIQLKHHHLTIQNVDLSIQVPSTGNGSLSLFAIDSGCSLRLINSTITIAPGATSWTANTISTQPEGAAILPKFLYPKSRLATSSTVSSLPNSRRSSTSTDATNDPISIEIRDSVIRGTGSMLNLPQAHRTELLWRNGLLSISGRMIECGGASEQTRTPPTIRLDLEDVTLATQKGWARIHLTSFGRFPVCISRESKNCTYWNEREFPFIAIDGMDDTVEPYDADETPSWLSSWIDLRGIDNAYDESIENLIRINASQANPLLIGFENSPDGFFSEKSPETKVRWTNSLPSNKPFFTQSPTGLPTKTRRVPSRVSTKPTSHLRQQGVASSKRGECKASSRIGYRWLRP